MCADQTEPIATGFPALMLRALASASTIPAGRPGPSSATSRTTYSPSAAQSKVIVPPSDMASTADPDSHRLHLVEMSARVGEPAEFRRSATSGRPRRLSRSDELVLQIMQDVGDRSAERSRDRFESTRQSGKLCSRLDGAPGREHTLETVISLADAHPRTNLAPHPDEEPRLLARNPQWIEAQYTVNDVCRHLVRVGGECLRDPVEQVEFACREK